MPDKIHKSALDKLPQHAILIAKIMCDWGEVLFNLLLASGRGHIQPRTLMDMVWNIRTDSIRVDVLCLILREVSNNYGHGEDGEKTISKVKTALSARNRYAHCHWLTGEQNSTNQINLVRVDWSREYKKFFEPSKKVKANEIGSVITLRGLNDDYQKIVRALNSIRDLDEKLAENQLENHLLRKELSEVANKIRSSQQQTADEKSPIITRPLKRQTGKSDRDQ